MKSQGSSKSVSPHPTTPYRMPPITQLLRRDFLRTTAFYAAATASTNLLAETLELQTTSPMTEGPFYPDKLPLDTDNDLLVINDAIHPSVGEITHLTGTVLDASGAPVRNAVVEIWQVDGKGVYLHSQSQGKRESDPNFQGFGRCATSSKGAYYFRTVKPVPYPGRTPHIHFRVNATGYPRFTTQCFIRGHEQNASDGLLRRLEQRKSGASRSLMVDFKPMKDSNIGELAANFRIVLGKTASDKTASDS